MPYQSINHNGNYTPTHFSGGQLIPQGPIQPINAINQQSSVDYATQLSGIGQQVMPNGLSPQMQQFNQHTGNPGIPQQPAPDGMSSYDGLGLAVQGASSLASVYMGMKQYGLAKETLAQNKLQYEQNYANQQQLTNSRLEDRQRARVASNPGAYESVSSYLDKNRIK